MEKLKLNQHTAADLIQRWKSVKDGPGLLASLNTATMDVQNFDTATNYYAAALQSGNQDNINAALAALDTAYSNLSQDRTPIDSGFSGLGILS